LKKLLRKRLLNIQLSPFLIADESQHRRCNSIPAMCVTNPTIISFPALYCCLTIFSAIPYLNTSFPFTGAFGRAGNRKECFESAQMVYDRLLLSTPGRNCLKFDTIALLALDSRGELDDEFLKELIRVL
jgi:hypothetical protein